LGREAVELNLNKKKVVFKEKDFVEFDALVIATGRGIKLPISKASRSKGLGP